MITALILRKFGRFSERTLKLAPFTVITGPNEAGKTTVFDALFDNLCKCNKKDSLYQRVKDRYGKDRRAALEWAPGTEQPKYDAHEFLDIFAIRGGQVHIEASGGGAWLKAFRNALFSGGMDPAELSEELLEAASEVKSKPLIKKLAGLEAEAAELKKDLDAEMNRRTAVFAGEEALKKLAAVLDEVKIKTADKEAKLAALKPEYETARDGAELDRVRRELALLRELEALEEKLGGLAGYSEGALGAYDLLTAALEKKKEELTLLRGQQEEKEKALAAAKAALEAARSAVPLLRRRSAQAEISKTEIDNFLAAAAVAIRKTVNFPVRLTIWAAGLALAAGLYFWLKGAGGIVVGYVVALLAGAVGWFAAIKTTVGYTDPQAARELLARLADTWSNAGLDAAPVKRETLQGVKDALASVQAELKAAEAALEKSEESFAGAEKERNELSIKAGMAEDARREAEGSAQRWLAKTGCKSRDEYRSKADERAKTASDAEARRATASASAKSYGCRDIKDFKFRLQDRADQLERAGARPGLPEEELRRLERAYERLRYETQELKERLLREEADLQKAREVAATRLEGVPEAISRLAVAAQAKEAEAVEVRLTLAGYKIAAGAFERIAANSTIKLEILTAEVGGTLKKLLPGRRLQFPSFGLDGAAMGDAGGEPRPLEQLSSGTRDIFMLAARLSLAKRSRTGADGKVSPALLVLDEPFYALDAGRIATALELLSEFQKETGWQILLLTKDPAVAEAAKTTDGLTMTEIVL